jgi:hypothetical protein
LHTVALAIKVLLDFFQKIASPSFRQAESWQRPRSRPAGREIPFSANLRTRQDTRQPSTSYL